MSKTGRPLMHPKQDSPLDVYSIRITAFHARMARQLGNGNLSNGIRLALERVIQNYSENPTKNVNDSLE